MVSAEALLDDGECLEVVLQRLRMLALRLQQRSDVVIRRGGRCMVSAGDLFIDGERFERVLQRLVMLALVL